MIPGSGGTQRLVRLIGLRRAKDIVMRGRRVLADEALALGLVGAIMPANGLDAAVAGLVEELAVLRRLALAMAKRVLNAAYDGPLHLGPELEGLAYGLLRRRTIPRGRRGVRRSARPSSPASDAGGRVRPRASGPWEARRVEAAFRRPRPAPKGQP